MKDTVLPIVTGFNQEDSRKEGNECFKGLLQN